MQQQSSTAGDGGHTRNSNGRWGRRFILSMFLRDIFGELRPLGDGLIYMATIRHVFVCLEVDIG